MSANQAEDDLIGSGFQRGEVDCVYVLLVLALVEWLECFDRMSPHMSNTLRIAVTGGNGEIGSQVCAELMSRGHQVTSFDLKANPENKATWIYLDVSNRAMLQPALAGMDAVVHLGEVPNVKQGIPHEIYLRNTQIGSTLLQTVADLGIKRVVYASTCQVYGVWGPNHVPPLRLPVDEDHPVQPVNEYSLSKVANETYARYLSNRHGLSVAIMRMPWVVMPQQAERMVNWISPGEVSKWLDDGMSTNVHVHDVARAFATAAERPLPGCRVYNLSADRCTVGKPLAGELERLFPHWPKLPADWGADRSPLTTERARIDLDWVPQWSFPAAYRAAKGQDLMQESGGK